MGIPVPKPKFHRRVPIWGKRSEFSPGVRKEILDRDNHECQICGSTWRLEIHHIVERGRGGRGVKENGITLCWKCHDNVQHDQKLLDKLFNDRLSECGDNFWCDEWDREAYLK